MNRYDELNNLIEQWTDYVELHERYCRNKQTTPAWIRRMELIKVKIEQFKLEKELICELNNPVKLESVGISTNKLSEKRE